MSFEREKGFLDFFKWFATCFSSNIAFPANRYHLFTKNDCKSKRLEMVRIGITREAKLMKYFRDFLGCWPIKRVLRLCLYRSLPPSSYSCIMNGFTRKKKEDSLSSSLLFWQQDAYAIFPLQKNPSTLPFSFANWLDLTSTQLDCISSNGYYSIIIIIIITSIAIISDKNVIWLHKSVKRITTIKNVRRKCIAHRIIGSFSLLADRNGRWDLYE